MKLAMWNSLNFSVDLQKEQTTRYPYRVLSWFSKKRFSLLVHLYYIVIILTLNCKFSTFWVELWEATTKCIRYPVSGNSMRNVCACMLFNIQSHFEMLFAIWIRSIIFQLWQFSISFLWNGPKKKSHTNFFIANCV